MERRQFLRSSAATATGTALGALSAASPTLLLGQKGRDTKPVLGQGEHLFEVEHDWARLPDHFSWQVTHNVAVDSAGFVYVIHEGRLNLPDHPAIFCFDPAGEYVHSFGSFLQGGGHGLEIRNEDGTDFLYVTGYLSKRTFAKLTTQGEIVWQQSAPMESGAYAADELERTEKIWARDRFHPTNFAFLDDGGFLLADGYGTHMIHRYDKEAKYQSSIGGTGKKPGQFNLPHGLCIDRRGSQERVIVCDRSHNQLQYLSLDGKHLKTQKGFFLPANVEIHDGLLLLPELKSQISLLDSNDRVVSVLGSKEDKSDRTQPKTWQEGSFVHPHDACWDKDGNILVAEWVVSGRISRLRRVS